jgi:hypothetical protein
MAKTKTKGEAPAAWATARAQEDAKERLGDKLLVVRDKGETYLLCFACAQDHSLLPWASWPTEPQDYALVAELGGTCREAAAGLGAHAKTAAPDLAARILADAERPAVPTGDPARVMELAAELEQLRAEQDDLDEHLKGIKARLAEVVKRELPDAMVAAGMVNAAGKGQVSLASGGKVHLATSTHFDVKAADRPGLYDFFRRTGNGSVIVPWVFPQTQAKVLKELAEQGVELPGFVSQYAETAAVYTAPKGGRK